MRQGLIAAIAVGLAFGFAHSPAQATSQSEKRFPISSATVAIDAAPRVCETDPCEIVRDEPSYVTLSFKASARCWGSPQATVVSGPNARGVVRISVSATRIRPAGTKCGKPVEMTAFVAVPDGTGEVSQVIDDRTGKRISTDVFYAL